MNGDSSNLFRVFRVLWFPMSMNAVVLGAMAVLLFYVGTWVGCLVIGEPGAAGYAAKAFYPASVNGIKTGTWPGFATEKDGDRYTHHLRAKDAKDRTPQDMVTVREDEAILQSLFTGYIAERAAEVETDKDLTSAEKKEARESLEKSLEKSLPRYRWVFALQIALFFFLWATFGVAICRILALRIARDEYCLLGGALSYAWKIKLTGILYPIAVLLPVGFLVLCNHLAGIVTWIPWVGSFIGIFLLPLVIVSTLLLILILLAAFVSLGLMPAAIAVERKGTYDSLGKAFNYVFARPLPLILHLVTLYLFLNLLHGLLVEDALLERVLSKTMAPLWSDGTFEAMVSGRPEGLDGHEWFFGWIYKGLLTIYRLLLWGALFSYALGAFTSLFLILRQDVDGMDYAEVARDPAEVHGHGAAVAAEPAGDGQPSGDTSSP